MEPFLEINEKCIDKTDCFTTKNGRNELCSIMVCPPTGEDYWSFRVKLCKDQAVLGFPKYGLVGVGMALEENGNTNLPLHSPFTAEENAENIADHIKCNKKYKSITRKMIVDAIILIDKGARQAGLLK